MALNTKGAAACIFFTPFFTAVYNQERLILQTIYVLKSGNYSKKSTVYYQEGVIMARVRYISFDKIKMFFFSCFIQKIKEYFCDFS